MKSFDLYESFNINRILLLAIGLWPYQRSKLVHQCQLLLIYTILISFIAFQLTTFVTAECTLNITIKILSSTLFFIMHMVHYNSFLTNGQSVKHLMEQLQRICNDLKDEKEIAIIKKYGNNAKLYTIALTGASISGTFVIFSLPIWSYILDVVLSTNKSTVYRTTQIMTEYFIDAEKYFYFILLHMDASYFIGCTIVIATGTLFVAYVQYACGIFKIASYRIEQALSYDILRRIGPKNEIMIHKEIIYAVDIHRKAMKFSEFMITSFKGLFSFLIVTGVISLSLNLFLILQILSFGGDMGELLFHLSYLIIVVVYMFIASYISQEIMDHNNHVFITTYNVRWYLASLHTQKMILFLLQRGNKSFTLNLGNIFIGSLQSFASMVNISISYFTVIYSTQK
ncbi:uncharacterized protein LOC109503866 [Harpegnathos saltator]|uniref:uncharacterized protein LOC109503866 n=1 Tax=Harpegnathos saltator TaxID=610380 RepID=UPI00094908AE|nr:uncharacterized protein LOC109503866 [Harpegnathos saltator]